MITLKKDGNVMRVNTEQQAYVFERAGYVRVEDKPVPVEIPTETKEESVLVEETPEPEVSTAEKSGLMEPTTADEPAEEKPKRRTRRTKK